MTEQGRVRYPGRLAHDDALARLRRVHGQLGGVIHMMEQDRSTTEVLTLLAAVTHALHRAGFRMVADELERCRNTPDGCDGLNTDQLEKLFLSLG
jgi:DNA-binding FrmR family transcriptional regulator